MSINCNCDCPEISSATFLITSVCKEKIMCCCDKSNNCCKSTKCHKSKKNKFTDSSLSLSSSNSNFSNLGFNNFSNLGSNNFSNVESKDLFFDSSSIDYCDCPNNILYESNDCSKFSKSSKSSKSSKYSCDSNSTCDSKSNCEIVRDKCCYQAKCYPCIKVKDGGYFSMSLNVTANPTTYSTPGEIIIYTYTITNTGTNTLMYPIIIHDSLIGDTTTNHLYITPNNSHIITRYYTIKNNDLTQPFLVSTIYLRINLNYKKNLCTPLQTIAINRI